MRTTSDVTGRVEGSAGDTSSIRPLHVFAAVAVPSGWLFLGLSVGLGIPSAPFVLLTLFLGLVLPAILLTRRDPGADVRSLLRDCFRLPRRGLLLVPALGLIPGLTSVGAWLAGEATTVDVGLLSGAAVNVVSSVLIVNLWEEMAWQGFFQRRASARWGFLGGSLVTTALFVAVHLPLAFDDADDAEGVAMGVAALVVSGIGIRLLTGAYDAWSGRSILTVAVLHASFNVASEFVRPEADWIRYAVTLTLGLLVLLTPLARRRQLRGVADSAVRAS